LVDERDFWILSELRKNPFLSYETLGRGIGLSGKAVKTRIESLERTNVLAHFQAMPAARVFQRHAKLFFFKEPLASLESLGDVIRIDPVIFATADVNRKTGVLLYATSASAAPSERLLSYLGPVERSVTPLLPHPKRDDTKPILLAELKVLRELVLNLRATVKEIANSTRLSYKVAKKVRNQLLNDSLIQVQPIFQSAQSSQILMCELHVRGDAATVSRIRTNLAHSTFLNQWDDGTIILSMWANSIGEVFETERRLKGETGISSAFVKFHARTMLSTERLTSWIDEEILYAKK